MNSLKINLPLQPQRTELEKKENFYKVMAAVIFIIGLVIVFSDLNIFTSLVFLLFLFVSFRLLKSARGEDFLKVLDNSYLYIDDERLTLHRSRYAFQRGELTMENTVFWSRVRDLHISPESIDVVQGNGEHRHIELDMLPAARLQEVMETLHEVKARYNI